VLEAHDVTFFANIPRLRAGDTITITAPCRSWTYTVGGAAVQAEYPVANQPEPTLVLITCYPGDALFRTNQRYVLTASLTRIATVVVN
jgi:sortase (surface protein transpeptidase)